MLEKVLHQTEAVDSLRKTISGQNKTPLLLVGPSGVGKKYSVLCAAKEMVDQDDSQVYCLDRGIHPDFKIISPEKNVLRVDDVRTALEWSSFRPKTSPLKMAVFDGIDCASPATANSLLKTLEEPPDYVRFFLLAESASDVLPTIVSRCRLVNYRKLPLQLIVDTLKEFTDDVDKAHLCAVLSEGSIGQAIDILNSGKLMLRDQVWHLISSALNRDFVAVHTAIDAMAADLSLTFRFLEHALHDIAMYEYKPSLIMNSDKVMVAEKLSSTLSKDRQLQLRSGLRDLQSRQSSSLNHAFHLKTLISTVFGAF